MLDSPLRLLDINTSDETTVSMTQPIRHLLNRCSQVAFLVGALLLAVVLAAPSSVAQDVPVLTDDVVDSDRQAGDTFTVPVRVENLDQADDVFSYDITLDYSGAPVSFDGFETSGTLTDDAGMTTDQNDDESAEQAEIAAFGNQPLSTGGNSGVVVRATFTVDGQGSGSVTFPNVKFNDVNDPDADLSRADFDVIFSDNILSIEDARVRVGQTGTVEVSATDLSGLDVTSLDIEIAVSDPVELDGQNPVTFVTDELDQRSADYDASTDTLSVSGFSTSGALSGDEVLFELRTQALSSEASASIAFDDANTELRDSDGNVVSGVALKDGSLEAVANDAPTISQISDRTIGEDTQLGPIDFTVGDQNNDPSELTVSGTSDNADLVPEDSIELGGSGANRTATVTPTADSNGTATITLTVTDPEGAEASESFDLAVNPDPDAPNAEDDQYSMLEGDTLRVRRSNGVKINDTHPDGESFTVSEALVTRPSNGEVTLSTDGSFEYIPNEDFTGTDQFEYKVSDGDSTDTAIVMIDVEQVNNQPTISELADQTIDEDGELSVGFTIGDAETATENLSLATQSNDADLVPGDSIEIEGSGADRTLVVEPTADSSGTATISVTVTDQEVDGEAAKDSTQSFVLTVEAVNDPPVANGEEFETTEDVVLSVPAEEGVAHTADLEASQSGENGGFGAGASTGSGNARITLFENDASEDVLDYQITLSGLDFSTFASEFDETAAPGDDVIGFHIHNASRGNQGGILFGIVGSAGSPFDTGATDDADREVTVNNEEGSVQISGTWEPGEGNADPSTLASAIENANEGDDVPLYLNVHTDANQGGEIRGQVVKRNSIAGLLANDSDVEDPVSALTADVVSEPENGTLTLESDGAFEYDPDQNYSGTDTFEYSATDTGGAADTAEVQITVTAEEDAPTISAISDTTIEEDGTTGPIDFTVDDAETAPEDLSVTASSGNTDLVPDDSIDLGGSGSDRTVTVTPTADSNGTAAIELVVENGDSLTDTTTFDVTVEPVNDGPFFTSVPPDTTALVGEELSLQVGASPGPGETSDQVTFSLVDPPADSSADSTATIDPDTGELTFTPTPDQSDSTLVITAQAEDSEGLTATDSFEVSVEFDVLLGDVTGNGSVSAFDANRTLRASVQLSPPRPLSTRDSIAADVRGDGDIDGGDARLILEFVVGIIDTFPAAESEESSAATASATAKSGATAELAWGETRTADDQTVVPIRVTGNAGSVQSVDVTVSGDIGAIDVDRVESALPDGWMMVQGKRDGELRIAMASARPLQETGEIVRLPVSSDAGEKQDLSLSAEGTVAGTPMSLGEAPITGAAESFELLSNYPNPVRERMTISLNVPEDAKVGVEMYDVLGRQVASFSKTEVAAGQEQTLQIDASGLSSGSYFYRVRAETASQEWTETGRVTVVR
jgi:hypothetical protein